MTFQPGQKKIAGRQKGTPNKATYDLAAKLNAIGFDITKELRDLYPKLHPDTKAKVLMELHEYIYPKRKALMLSPDEGADPTGLEGLSDAELVAEGKKALKVLAAAKEGP